MGRSRTLSDILKPSQQPSGGPSSPAGAQRTIRENGTVVPSLVRLEGFLESLRCIAAETDPFDAAMQIIDHTCKIVECERASLFFVDDDTKELELLVARGLESIRLPIGAGIVGQCAELGLTINVHDAYEDDRFNRDFDTKSGFRTKHILATPIIDFHGEIVAVLQAINKKSGEPFTHEDEIFMENFAAHVGITLRNAQRFEAIEQAKSTVTSLMDIVKVLHSNPNANSLVFTLTQRAPQLVGAERCTLWLADQQRQTISIMNTDSATMATSKRFPMGKGLAGHVAATGQVLNIKDAYEDSRFNKSVDKETGMRTRELLCVPIHSPDRSVIGVLQMVNKIDSDGEGFSDQDSDTLVTLLDIAGSILSKSRLFHTHADTHAEANEAMPVDLNVSVPSHKSQHHLMHKSPSQEFSPCESVIEEGDEDE